MLSAILHPNIEGFLVICSQLRLNWKFSFNPTWNEMPPPFFVLTAFLDLLSHYLSLNCTFQTYGKLPENFNSFWLFSINQHFVKPSCYLIVKKLRSSDISELRCIIFSFFPIIIHERRNSYIRVNFRLLNLCSFDYLRYSLQISSCILLTHCNFLIFH